MSRIVCGGIKLCCPRGAPQRRFERRPAGVPRPRRRPCDSLRCAGAVAPDPAVPAFLRDRRAATRWCRSLAHASAVASLVSGSARRFATSVTGARSESAKGARTPRADGCGAVVRRLREIRPPLVRPPIARTTPSTRSEAPLRVIRGRRVAIDRRDAIGDQRAPIAVSRRSRAASKRWPGGAGVPALRHEPLDRVVQAELAGVAQLHHQHRGEGLAQRRDQELVVGGRR